MLQYEIKKYIGSYAAAMNGLDAVLFTGGIGENASEVREGVCSDIHNYFSEHINFLPAHIFPIQINIGGSSPIQACPAQVVLFMYAL